MRSYIANVFGGIDGLIKRNTQGRTSFDIDYDMLQKRDVKESRFVIGKIIMETICCALDHEVTARREEDQVVKDIVEKQQKSSACQSLPAKNMMFDDDVFTRVKRELQQKKEEKQLATKKQKVVKTEDNKYVVAKLKVTGEERLSLSRSQVANMPKTVENCKEEITHSKCNVPEGGVAADKKRKSQASKGKGSLGSLSALFK